MRCMPSVCSARCPGWRRTWSGAEADPSLLAAPGRHGARGRGGDRAASRAEGPFSPYQRTVQAEAGRRGHRGRPPTTWPSPGSAGCSRSRRGAACAGRRPTAPRRPPAVVGAARAARRPRRHVLGLLAAAGDRRLLQHAVHPDGHVRRRRVRRRRSGAGRRRPSSGWGSCSASSCWCWPTAWAGAGSWSAPPSLAPLLGGRRRAGAVVRVAHRHPDARPARGIAALVSWSRSWPPRRCPRGSGPTPSACWLWPTRSARACASWPLPLADLGERGWRLMYVVPLVYLVVAPQPGRGAAREPPLRAPPRRGAPLPAALPPPAASALLINLFVAPATFFKNRYLKDVRATRPAISLFTLCTTTPGGIGIVVGGRLADVRGRRLVGAIALLGGGGGHVVVFSTRRPGCGWPSRHGDRRRLPSPPSGSTGPSCSRPSPRGGATA